MKRTFSLAQAVYALFYIIINHGYLEKEKPYVSVQALLNSSDLVRASRMGQPPRCSRAAPVGRVPQHHVVEHRHRQL